MVSLLNIVYFIIWQQSMPLCLKKLWNLYIEKRPCKTNVKGKLCENETEKNSFKIENTEIINKLFMKLFNKKWQNVKLRNVKRIVPSCSYHDIIVLCLHVHTFAYDIIIVNQIFYWQNKEKNYNNDRRLLFICLVSQDIINNL